MMLLERASSLHRLRCSKAACWCFTGMPHLVQTPIHVTLPGAHHPEDRHWGKPQGYFCREAVVPSVPGAVQRDAPRNLLCMEREPGCSGRAGGDAWHYAEYPAML